MHLEVSQPQLRNVQLDSIRESKTNPRRTFDPAKLHELGESIAKQGLFSPLLVRRTEDLEPYEIIAGARRLRACRLAGLDQVPCLVYDVIDDKAVLEIQLVENAQREDVAPLEEAEGYSRLVDDHGYTFANLAKRVGKSEQHIVTRIKLLELSNSAREALIAERISIGHANLLARLTIEQQDGLINWLLDESDCEHALFTVRELAEHIQSRVFRALNNAPFSLVQRYLVTGVPPCTECPKNSAAQQALFADLAGHAICTDGKCFDLKVDKHVEAKLHEVSTGELPAVAISTRWNGDKVAQALPDQHYKVVEVETSESVQALAVDGPQKGRILHVVVSDAGREWLNEAAKTKADAPAEADEPKQPAKSWEQQRKEEDERRQAESKLRTRMRIILISQIAERESGQITLEKLRLLVDSHHVSLEANQRRIFAQLCAEDESLFAKGIPTSYFDKKVSLDDYFWALSALELASDAIAGQYENRDLSPIQAGYAKLLDIDVSALKKQAKAELKTEAQEAKKPAKNEEAKPKGKATKSVPDPAPEAAEPAPEKKKRGRPKKQK